jgi:hypothetical protein
MHDERLFSQTDAESGLPILFCLYPPKSVARANALARSRARRKLFNLLTLTLIMELNNCNNKALNTEV